MSIWKSPWNAYQTRNYFMFGISVLFVGLVLTILYSKSQISSQPTASIDSQENGVQFSHRQGTRRTNTDEKCDLLNGDWIPNMGGPSYTNMSCNFIANDQNCIKNGRPDSDYLYWRWKPCGCDLPQPDANWMGMVYIHTNERRAALRAENKSVTEVAKITGEEWKNMNEKQRAPYETMALKAKEQYVQEMEVYKQKKDDEAANVKKEGEELMKLQKHEAMQLLKKKEKTEILIKKTKEKQQKQKKEKNVDPNKPKKPASSYLLYSKETRKNLAEERPGISNATINALISVKWKEISEEEKQVWNRKAAEAMEVYKKELEAYNKNLPTEEESKN